MSLDILQLTEAWQPYAGFPQPDWKIIRDTINRTFPEAARADAWNDACLQWLGAIRHALGADTYHLFESTNFVLLTVAEKSAAKDNLLTCENALVRLRHRLGPLAWRWTHGKHAVLMFDDVDAYYRYISFFYPEEGEFSGSEASFLNRGYCHTAVSPMRYPMPALIHELTHLCLAHLRIPRWLNEGLATTTTIAIGGTRSHAVDRDVMEQHETFWNSDTIQDFWNGKSFHTIDGNRVSYSLAQILVDNMQNDYKSFPDFVKDAKFFDGGEASALAHLGDSLGTVAAVFLGAGDWAPRPNTRQDTPQDSNSSE